MIPYDWWVFQLACRQEARSSCALAAASVQLHCGYEWCYCTWKWRKYYHGGSCWYRITGQNCENSSHWKCSASKDLPPSPSLTPHPTPLPSTIAGSRQLQVVGLSTFSMQLPTTLVSHETGGSPGWILWMYGTNTLIQFLAWYKAIFARGSLGDVLLCETLMRSICWNHDTCMAFLTDPTEIRNSFILC